MASSSSTTSSTAMGGASGGASPSVNTIGVTRSLTRKFMELRDGLNISKSSVVHEPFEVDSPGSSSSAKLLGVPSNPSADADPAATVPPLWASEADSLTALMEEIRAKIGELQRLHASQFTVEIDDSVQGEQRAIEISTAKISRLLGEAQRKIKVLKRVIDNPETTIEECVIIKNVQSGFAAQLSDLTKQFRQVQQTYLARTRDREEKTKDSFSGPSAAAAAAMEEYDDAEAREGDYTDYEDKGFNADQMAQLRVAENRVDQRGKDLQRVYRSIIELNEMVKDLSLLIIDQGTILDRIDYNIENAATSVERGVVELQQASNSQRAARSKLCIIILIVLIIIAAAVLFFRLF